jgi:hypothetical protein
MIPTTAAQFNFGPALASIQHEFQAGLMPGFQLVTTNSKTQKLLKNPSNPFRTKRKVVDWEGPVFA